MVLIHESYHWRLDSGDEASVNACALRDFPSWLTQEVGVQSTIAALTNDVHNGGASQGRDQVRLEAEESQWQEQASSREGQDLCDHSHAGATNHILDRAKSDVSGNGQRHSSFYASQPYPYNAGTCPS